MQFHFLFNIPLFLKTSLIFLSLMQDKYIIPEKARKGVFSRINDAWRRQKKNIKKNCFLKYSTMRERLKNCPPNVSEAHLKQLIAYWRSSTAQVSLVIWFIDINFCILLTIIWFYVTIVESAF